MILKKNKISSIGLDISDMSIKMIQLKKHGNKITLQAINRASLNEGIMNKGQIQDSEKLSSAIKKLLTKPILGSFYGNETVICLPETSTYLKLINIERNPNEIGAIIETEIEKNIPVAINEIYYDWQKVKEGEDSDYFLIGASPISIVDSYLASINNAGLSVVSSEIEAVAICRSLLTEESPFSKNDKNSDNSGNYGIIDVGAKRSSLIIYSKNTPVISISIPISSHKTTKEISKKLEINREQAEKAKIICGLDDTKARGIVKEILSSMIKDLIDKIRSGIEYYNNHYPEFGTINKIILCGGGSNIKDLDKIIAKELFIETQYGSIITHLDKSTENFLNKFSESHNLDLKILNSKKSDIISVKQDSSLSYTAAMGLALRSVFGNKI
jgi:type IV pilus assembly protein PilM